MELKALEKETIINTYNRQPETTLLLERGAGVYVWDDAGKRYLDFVSGLAVNNLGHCHPQIVEAICRQARQLMHTSNLYYTEPQIRLAEQLVETFLCRESFSATAAQKLMRLPLSWRVNMAKLKRVKRLLKLLPPSAHFMVGLWLP